MGFEWISLGGAEPRTPPANSLWSVLWKAAPGGGLWWTDRSPHERQLPLSPGASLSDCAAQFLAPYLCEQFTPSDVRDVCRAALPEDPGWTGIDERTFMLELYQGPTAAFKDTGAQVLARLLELAWKYGDDAVIRRDAGRPTVLVATSGDTGAAVAAAFEDHRDFEVVLLYPRGRISDFQAKHLHSFGSRVHAFEVEGTFDDCARLAREVRADVRYRGRRQWISANSIHPFRLLPQAAHALWAASKLRDLEGRAESDLGLRSGATLVVPSGNLGHLCAGLAAQAAGLRVGAWLAAHNANRAFVDWVNAGALGQPQAVSTWSNAMDIARPGNFERLASVLRASEPSATVLAESIGDDETLEAMQLAHSGFGLELCPHTAVGWAALERQRRASPEVRERPAVLFATAHPVKFAAARRAAGLAPCPPPSALAEVVAGSERPGQTLSGGADELHKRLR